MCAHRRVPTKDQPSPRTPNDEPGRAVAAVVQKADDGLQVPQPPLNPAIDPLRDHLRAQLFGPAGDDDGPASPRIGRFVVLREAGAGGMGHVYVAYDDTLERKVAIKVLRADLAARPLHQQRLLREAQALARLAHPNVVTIYEVGQTDEQVFLAMELVAGVSLRRWQQAEQRPWRELLERYLDAARGLAAAHAVGLTHRDFKPDNVLVGDDGRVRVVDFGLAYGASPSGAAPLLLDEDERAQLGGDETTSALAERITQTGTRMGTPAYMAPEQRRGEAAGPAADQYAFCVSLYEALVGERPHPARPIPPSASASLAASSGCPRWLMDAVLMGLSPEPSARHPDMSTLIDRLARRLQRRRRFGGLLVAVGLLGAGVIARPQAVDPCEAVRHEVDPSWGPSHQDALVAAFMATGVPYAEQSWHDATQALDRYAQSWTRARVDACEATHVRHIQSTEALDLRSACLDGRRRELTALVEALSRVDALGVARASEAIASLSDVESCNDLEALRRGVSPPPADQAPSIEQLRRALANARSAARLGDYVRAERMLDATLGSARALEYAPLTAEALELSGWILRRRGELSPAEQTLLEAVDLAESHHHDELAASAWAHLSMLATRRLRDPTRGRRWLRRAWAAARRIGLTPVREADLLEEAGHLAMLANRYDEAEQTYAEALALRRSVHEQGHLSIAATAANLANCHYESGDVDRAHAEYEEVIAALTERFGPEHPRVAEQRFNLALVLEVSGQLSAAAEHLDATLASYQKAYGRRSLRLVQVLSQRAKVAEHRGRVDEALTFAQQAEALLRAAPDGSPSHERDALALISTLNVIGTLHYRQRHFDAALESFTRALELTASLPEPAPLQVAMAQSNVGDALLALGRPAEAHERYTRALDRMTPLLPADHEVLSFPLLGRGQAALAQGDIETAVEPLRRALKIRRAHPGNTPELATTSWALARALGRLTPPQNDEARSLAEQAQLLYQQLGDHEHSAEIDQWLRREPADAPSTQGR